MFHFDFFDHYLLLFWRYQIHSLFLPSLQMISSALHFLPHKTRLRILWYKTIIFDTIKICTHMSWSSHKGNRKRNNKENADFHADGKGFAFEVDCLWIEQLFYIEWICNKCQVKCEKNHKNRQGLTSIGPIFKKNTSYLFQQILMQSFIR